MGIQYHTDTGVFTLETARTSYHMQVDERGHLLQIGRASCRERV